MKYITAFIMVFFIILIACESKKTPQESTDHVKDAYTFATPKGSELLPAERGPVRDVYEPPAVNLASFKLKLDGKVSTHLELGWRQIQEMQSVSTDTMLMYCVEGWEVWGVWRGISINELLDSAQPAEDATHVLFHGIDGYTTAMPMTYLRKYNAILAYEVNGRPLKKHDGYPLRLVAFGLFGYKWAKYVTRLELISGSRLGFWEKYGYDDKALVPVERRRFYEGANAEPIEF